VKPSLRQIAFDGGVVDGRIRVHEAVRSLRPCSVDDQHRSRPGDTPALERRDDGPARLEGRLAGPLAIPIADAADRQTAGLVDDLEHTARPQVADLLVPLLALHQLLVTLGTPEMLGHGRVAEELLQEREVTGSPRFDANGVRLGHGRQCTVHA
jgi:hypothetical protein